MNYKTLTIGGALLAILFAVPADAAKRNREDRMAGRMMGRFDANKDGSIDTSEAERVRKAFDALKALDIDNDGKLSDTEITAAKVVVRKGGGKRKQKLN
jgi:Ca2+-binding EF-hand superfamily protein